MLRMFHMAGCPYPFRLTDFRLFVDRRETAFVIDHEECEVRVSRLCDLNTIVKAAPLIGDEVLRKASIRQDVDGPAFYSVVTAPAQTMTSRRARTVSDRPLAPPRR